MATKLPVPLRATDRSDADAQRLRSSERDGKPRPTTAAGESIDDGADSLRADAPQFLVQLRPRHDGWSAERQIAFIEALAETACVEEACRRVGMSDSSAYKLRNQYRGRHFRAAWDAALDCALSRLEQAVLDRALHGTPRPIFFKGEQIGEWRHHDERLTMFLLRTRRAARYGRLHERGPLPDPDPEDERATPAFEDPARTLDGALDVIDLAANDPDQRLEMEE